MKRKLDENDAPLSAPEEDKTTETTPAANQQPADSASFLDFGLDSRLVQAVARLNFKTPTLVQQKAIPLALDGQDVLAKSKTGSGKTAAFLLPVLHAILTRKKTDSASFTAALILVPTRELADQIFKVIEQLTAFCAKDIQAVKLTDKLPDAVQRSLLQTSRRDIVVSTPARVWQNITSGALAVDQLTHLVLDEADLVLSYGYEEDLKNIAGAVPKPQTILTSATLSTEVHTLKDIFCRSPVLLDLVEKEAEGEGVTQFYVKCGEDEKFLLAYIMLKLKLISGKCIIFVADVDRCYRLKLFLEQFGIRSCILNSELPVNSRIHTVEEFNRNVYDIIIASDEHEVVGDEDEADEAQAGADNNDATTEEKRGKGEKQKKKKRKSAVRDKEFGVSRGIDFQRVSCVINFDLPTSSKSYTHKIGRTARAGQRGMAISFCVPRDLYRKHIPTSIESAENDEKVLARIIKQQAKKGKDVKAYQFDMRQVESFRYRMNDALRAVTKVAIREARTRELRQELLASEKLKRYFEENPTEIHHLRHDGELRTGKRNDTQHLRHVPEYLLPREGRKALTAGDVGFVPLRNPDQKNRRNKFFKKGKPLKAGAKKSDPLRTFKARRSGK
ncbi:ATP-dependent RNA helicase DBP9 [Pleurostoma richardsiae]|uniref:RNA helicase n=1 Tax=Pleurostoma richardsiae TaxID=41990 RepID=A0AA38R3H8_9PEZI|nr:ATP-dependent RNA helicase DBP9 [Pleurostoma richardsiae]